MTQPQPVLRPTSPATLVAAALASASVSWVLISSDYGSMPIPPWLLAGTLFVLGLTEMVLARGAAARIARKPGRPPVEPLQMARLVVLAKASSVVGALFGGYAVGVLIYLLLERSRLIYPDRDLPETIATVVAAIVLVIAALWLEHSCRVPKRPDDEETPT